MNDEVASVEGEDAFLHLFLSDHPTVHPSARRSIRLLISQSNTHKLNT